MDRSHQTLQEEIADLRVRIAARDAELSRWRQQYLLVDSLWTSLQGSWAWKMSAPLRAVRRWLAPRGFDHGALIPWQQLQQLDGETWRAHGPDSQFVVPCLLPRGWVRLQLRMTSTVSGRVEMLADYGDGFCLSECLARLECRGSVDVDRLLYLRRPARGARLDPLDAPGEFRLELLRVEPLALPAALAQSCTAKWQALRTKLQSVFGVDLPTGSTIPTAGAKEQPLVSIVIVCAGRPARVAGTRAYRLSRCVAAIRRVSTYSNYEIIVVHDGAIPEDLARDLAGHGAHLIAAGEPFNRATASNLGAARARGEQLVFLHEDVEVVTPHWLETMLRHAARPEIGVVGATICSPGGHTVGVSPRAAVSGACLMTHRDLFDAASGFTEELGLSYAEADYCLKAQRLGKGVLIAADAHVQQPRSRVGAYPAELRLFQARWPEHAWNPCHNPNLGAVCYDHRQ